MSTGHGVATVRLGVAGSIARTGTRGTCIPVGGPVSLLARPLRAAVCTVLVLSGCVTAGPAVADEPGCAQGRSLRYVVTFDRGTSEAAARGQISDACGATTVYYPQIAVAVATSGDPGFGARIGLDRAFSAQAERLAAQRATDPVKPQPARAALP
ncbi:serine protease, partial [Amycolatopsis sp. SID8362]|nr:serine protease [Amycolatopsis sp. SID8362]NED42899.1 serine protease [Amycolatopsis sp. SID8362]